MDVEAALAAVRAEPRRDYLPRRLRQRAAEDRPLPIGAGQTSSQPRTVVAMLALLDPRPGHRVLDVGAGSGWTTAALAHLVGPTGSVLGLELVPRLARWGAANVAASGQPWAALREADPGLLGAPAEGPYDRILVSADAAVLPQALVDQLAPGGVLVLPVDGVMHRVVVDADGSHTISTHGAYRFVPLL